uniref:Uncharacterized protein n=1 Tax=viral metagenome TaxID=1070528 RepID=A0A6M3LB71_9ZZZZ
MSNRKNRERAEAGLIWRNGGLVRKEDWYAAHPTPEMKRQTQREVDTAVAKLMESKRMNEAAQNGIIIVKDGRVLDPKDTSAVLAEAEPYYCTKCKVTHRKGKIHQEHHQYTSQIAVV